MNIVLENTGHRFGANVLFSDLNLTIDMGSTWVLRGANGSGKSTLLQILAGRIRPIEGKIHYDLPEEYVYRSVSVSAPGIDLYFDFTAEETFRLHHRFKDFYLPLPEVWELLRLKNYLHQPLKQLSSGTLQRVKVGLALFSVSEVLLLDEPTAFTDSEHAGLLVDLIQKYLFNRTYILASNIPSEWLHLESRQEILLGRA